MNNPLDGARSGNTGTIKIIGIGQSLRGDDGAGLAAVKLWQAAYPSTSGRPDVQVELCELPGIRLLSLLEGARAAILVDAVHGQAEAGTIHVFTEDQLEAFAQGSGSAHGWGVAETLSLGRKLLPSTLPKQLILVGIEAGQLNLGETLSVEVESALPRTASLIEQTIISMSLP